MSVARKMPSMERGCDIFRLHVASNFNSIFFKPGLGKKKFFQLPVWPYLFDSHYFVMSENKLL